MGNDFRIQDIIKEAHDKNKIICAICAAPLIIAKMGILENKSVTAFSGVQEQIKSFYANIKKEPVVVDTSEPGKKLITADGPESAIEFGRTILKYI
jgi:4-methyl-5(b-hydroxyethyl)-thiazole monophosphate biosynthesis